MKPLAIVLALYPLVLGVAHASACLRGDNIDHVKMLGADMATATDRDRHQFQITFVGPCGARHQNVFFVLRPESLPTCIVPGTALPTNKEGVCVIKAITAQP